MRIVFVSNYYNHHQSAFSEAMYELTSGKYTFIETEKMTEERKAMGWGIGAKPPFVVDYHADTQKAQRLIDEADYVIFGSAPDELLKDRHKTNKIVFRYSERFYKKGCPQWQVPLRAIKYYFRFGRFANDYMLCASAYTAADLSLTGNFVGKTYKWGYFPAVRQYDINELMGRKLSNHSPGWKHPIVSILWAGRLIGLKHPDVSIEVAERLKKEGYSFTMNIIGNGEMEEQLRTMIAEKNLSDCVNMLGAMKPDKVREHMELSDIFLFTSDFNEGWGAVLNESMNSGCTVVASHAIGSVPFLVKNGTNGVVYRNGNKEELYELVVKLIKEPDFRKRLGENAYNTMLDEWNPKIAAERFLIVAEEIRTQGVSNRFREGPCSKAAILKNDWYD